MFPFLDLGGMTYYMTWLGIFLWIVVFVYVTLREAKKHRLYTRIWVKRLPLYILIIYLLSTYSWYFVHDRVLIPLSRTQIQLYLSPRWYHFYLWGILIGALIVRRQFRKHLAPSPEIYAKRAYIYIKAAICATIPLGIFLLLGDNFIGRPYDGILSISAMIRDSNVATYGRVFPLGATLSAIALWRWLLITQYLEKKTAQPRKYAYLLIAGTLLSLSILLVFQIYPRYIVSKIGSRRFDLKNYIIWAMMFLALYQHITLSRRWNTHED